MTRTSGEAGRLRKGGGGLGLSAMLPLMLSP